MMQLVLLTGSTGFVGRQVLKALLLQSVRVRVVVRDEDPLKDCISQIESVIVTKDLFKEDQDWWADNCRDVDMVIHVAWYAEPGKYLSSPINLDCMTGSIALARGSAEAGVRKFVGVGTCFEYDLTDGWLSVYTPIKPTTQYSAAKAATFHCLSSFFSDNNVEFAWCRLFYLFGEGEDSRRLVPFLRSMLEANKPAELTAGTQVRDFMDVQDAGAKIAEVALGHQIGPVNVCSGKAITVRELAESIADEFGRRDLLCFGARTDNLVDPPLVVGIIEKETM